ncbi:MAG: hypothetical protein LBI11_00630 [Streptococcaceae bacterium]|jgi:hypothetical protein|nr:hypothetical protein [Streptococcaceae bacterium]
MMVFWVLGIAALVWWWSTKQGNVVKTRDVSELSDVELKSELTRRQGSSALEAEVADLRAEVKTLRKEMDGEWI